MAGRSDVIIVGAGPAGLSAALILGRACRSVRVFDHGRPRNAATGAVHGFLTRDGITPLELRRIGAEQLEPYTTVRLEQIEVTAAARDAAGFTVTLADGRRCASRTLLLATGVRDHLPDVPGLAALYGRSVFHCPYCDGWEFRGQPMAVYGRGARGRGLSLELLGWTHDVVLCTDGAADLRSRDREYLERHGVRIREEPIARLDATDGQLERIVFEHGRPLARRALFFTLGQTLCTELAASLGCEMNEKGTIRTGPYESTRIPGLYVAGDASRAVQWVVVAAAEGAEAAYAIHQALLKHDRRQNAARRRPPRAASSTNRARRRF